MPAKKPELVIKSARPASHLTMQQQQGKMYDYKAECRWCYAPYNKELSDALQPSDWCSLKCQTEDENLSTAYSDKHDLH